MNLFFLFINIVYCQISNLQDNPQNITPQPDSGLNNLNINDLTSVLTRELQLIFTNQELISSILNTVLSTPDFIPNLMKYASKILESLGGFSNLKTINVIDLIKSVVSFLTQDNEALTFLLSLLKEIIDKNYTNLLTLIGDILYISKITNPALIEQFKLQLAYYSMDIESFKNLINIGLIILRDNMEFVSKVVVIYLETDTNTYTPSQRALDSLNSGSVPNQVPVNTI